MTARTAYYGGRCRAYGVREVGTAAGERACREPLEVVDPGEAEVCLPNRELDAVIIDGT
jgi:hypothetical protein